MKMNVPLLRPEISEAMIDQVLVDHRMIMTNGILTNGKAVETLEIEVGRLIGIDHHRVVAVSNCTSGLMLAWQDNMDRRHWIGGEVLVPSFTFGATLLAILWNGLTPVLVDVCEETGEIDLNAAAAAINGVTVGIAPVDVFGRPCDYAAIRKFACDHNIDVVCDSAQSLGASFDDIPAGRSLPVHVYSMSPSKVASAAEGGLIVCDTVSRAARLRMMRDYGKTGKNVDILSQGMSARMSEFNGALGYSMVVDLPRVVTERRLKAIHYANVIQHRKMEGVRIIPWQTKRSKGNLNYFVVAIDPVVYCVETVCKRMKEAGIETKRYFTPDLQSLKLTHRHRKPITCSGALATSTLLSESCVALPMFSTITTAQQNYVIDTLDHILKTEKHPE